MKVKCIYKKENIDKYNFFTLGKIYECSKGVNEKRINIYDNKGYYWDNKRLDGKVYKFEIVEE